MQAKEAGQGEGWKEGSKEDANVDEDRGLWRSVAKSGHADASPWRDGGRMMRMTMKN